MIFNKTFVSLLQSVLSYGSKIWTTNGYYIGITREEMPRVTRMHQEIRYLVNAEETDLKNKSLV